MGGHKLGTILFRKHSEFVVTAQKPEYPEVNKAYPDNLHNDQGYNRIKQIFKSLHSNYVAPDTGISNLNGAQLP